MTTDDALATVQRNREAFRQELARIDRDTDATPAERAAARQRAHAFALMQHAQAVTDYRQAAHAEAESEPDERPTDINAAIRALAAGGASADAQARLDEAILLAAPALPR